MKTGEPLIFIGLKNCGKTTLAQLYAQQNNLSFVDIDDVITKFSNLTPRVLLKENGENTFKQYELKACIFAVEQKINVIATGGAFCQNNQAVEFLKKNGIFVYLKMPQKTFIERIFLTAKKESEFPAFVSAHNPQSEEEIKIILKKLYTERCKKYQILADVTLNTYKKTPQELVELLLFK